MQVYPGPQLPPDQVARIGGTFSFWVFAAKGVELESVDDTPVTAGDVEVMPGLHTISITYFSDTLNVVHRSRSSCFITFQAEPGHTYTANGELLFTQGVWRCWVDDKHTKQRTEGVFAPPRAWKQGADVQVEP